MQTQSSVAPARGFRYTQMLNSFIEHGDCVACEPRYAIIRSAVLVSQDHATVTHAYAYAIGCFMCGRLSWHPTDVNAHYCPFCRMFHDNV